jgi:hypothetical protein
MQALQIYQHLHHALCHHHQRLNRRGTTQRHGNEGTDAA